jgi:polysaccharide export outer membrane protein
MAGQGKTVWFSLSFSLMALMASGCASTGEINDELARVAYSGIPRELDKATLPDYRVEPPDILLIEAVNNIRTEDVPIHVGDLVEIRLGNPTPIQLTIPEDSTTPLSTAEQLQSQYELEQEVRNKLLDGEFLVQPDGMVHLGPVYGNVTIEGLTIEQAKEAIVQHLQSYRRDEQGNPAGLRDPQVTVSLPELAGKQVIAGEHLVRPDGAVSLGVYGSVYVTGMTLDEAKYAIERHLSRFIHRPEVHVDVLAYNSKSIYVITDGGGYGETVNKIPVTGNETVLDAISAIEGLSAVSSKRIWVARPAPAGTGRAQIMDVHWKAITQEGVTTTNYQLFPGDRVYIQADKLIHTDNFIAKVLAPAERIMGFTLLGTSVVRNLKFFNRQGGAVFFP